MLHVFFSHFILRDEPPSVIFNSTSIYLGYFLIFLYYFYIFWSIKLHFLSEVKLNQRTSIQKRPCQVLFYMYLSHWVTFFPS